jgi:hypothetical protein
VGIGATPHILANAVSLPDSVGVVAGGDQHLCGDVDTDPERVQ